MPLRTHAQQYMGEQWASLNQLQALMKSPLVRAKPGIKLFRRLLKLYRAPKP